MSLLTTQPRTLMTAHLLYVGESIRYVMTPPRVPAALWALRAAPAQAFRRPPAQRTLAAIARSSAALRMAVRSAHFNRWLPLSTASAPPPRRTRPRRRLSRPQATGAGVWNQAQPVRCWVNGLRPKNGARWSAPNRTPGICGKRRAQERSGTPFWSSVLIVEVRKTRRAVARTIDHGRRPVERAYNLCGGEGQVSVEARECWRKGRSMRDARVRAEPHTT
jgi:hypothetical protein